jgi:hypothetical protein
MLSREREIELISNVNSKMTSLIRILWGPSILYLVQKHEHSARAPKRKAITAIAANNLSVAKRHCTIDRKR